MLTLRGKCRPGDLYEDEMNSEPTLTPLVFDIRQLPHDFGTGRLSNLIVTFDNLERQFTLAERNPAFPVKCESFFTITIIEGEVRLLINLHEVTVRAGQLLVIMPGCIFQGQSVTPGMRFCGMVLDTEYMDSMRKNVGVRLDLTHRYYNYLVRDMDAAVMANHLAMYRMIRAELTSADYAYKKEVVQRYCEAWVLKNISLSNQDKIPEISKPLNRKEQIFHDFLTLLEKFYTHERSISFYADRMCLTPKYLSTIIKDVSGKHGMQWIDEYVTLEAKALLRNSELSVKQVSDELNFPSQSMFGRFFKKMTGYSPKQYKML